MVKSIAQVEKNTQASFGYVKKDLLMINDAMSDIHDKIQHLSLNHAGLLAEISIIKKKIGVKKSQKKAKPKSKPKSKNKKSQKKKKTGKKSPKRVVKTEEITYS